MIPTTRVYVPPTRVTPEPQHFSFSTANDPYCCGRTIVGGFRMEYNLPQRMVVDWSGVKDNKEFIAGLRQRFEMVERSYLTCTTSPEEGQVDIERILILTGWKQDDIFVNSNTNNEVTVWSFNKGYEKQEDNYDDEYYDGDDD